VAGFSYLRALRDWAEGKLVESTAAIDPHRGGSWRAKAAVQSFSPAPPDSVRLNE
jgi:hypothetical protein